MWPVTNGTSPAPRLSPSSKSLLLALNDRKILPEREIIGILEDAAAATREGY